MLKQLAIIAGCAACGFGLGRWLSAPVNRTPAAPASTVAGAAPAGAETATLPPPARAAQVPFTELYQTLRASSRGDQAAYLRSVQELPSGPTRRAALIAFFQCMASISPPAAAELVRQVVGKDDIQRAARAVLAATPASDTPLLVKMLLNLPGDVDPAWQKQQLRGQMFFWAALDPQAAAQFADENEGTYPGLAAGGIIGQLAARDAEAAEQWLAKHPALREDVEVMRDYVTGLYLRDPAEARRYLIAHGAEPAVQAALHGITRRTFFTSGEEAAEFIKQLPTADARRAALDGILDINVDLFATEEANSSALHAGITEWVTKFPEDEWPRSTSAFLQRWQELDPHGSLASIAQLPPTTRSAVASHLVGYLPGDRLKQIMAAAPADLRSEILAGYARQLPPSPEARRAIINGLQLSPEDAAQLAASPSLRQ